MAKNVYIQKNPFGGEVYLDENDHIIGYGKKDSDGKEVFLDKDLRYVGEKQKDLLGAEVLAEKGRTRKDSSGNTFYTDRDYSYMTRGRNSGSRDYVWLNGKSSGRPRSGRPGSGRSGAVKGILLAVLLAGAAAAVWLLLR